MAFIDLEGPNPIPKWDGWGQDNFDGPGDLPSYNNPGPAGGTYDRGPGGRIGYTDPPVASAPDTGQPSYYNSVADDYRKLLGRDPENNDVVTSWWNGTGGNLDAIFKGIAASPEALAYAARSQGGGNTSTAGRTDRNAIAAKVAQWASMPGADPSLGQNPDYWINRIIETGGLGADNEGYWQSASVGPSAFFRNPGREGGGGGGAAGAFLSSGTNPGGYTDPSSMLYLNQLLTRLQQVQQPQDNSIMELLKSLAMTRVNKLNEAPYSAADEQALITKYRDPLTQARDAAYARNKETASRKGFLPSSGLLRRMDSEVNRGYESGIAQGANQMGVNAVALKNSNAQQQLQILSDLLGVENRQVDRGNAMKDQAVNLAKMFPDFDAQRLDQMLRASGDTSANSGISGLLSLANLNANTLASNNANDQANSSAWGKLLAALLDGLNGKK